MEDALGLPARVAGETIAPSASVSFAFFAGRRVAKGDAEASRFDLALALSRARENGTAPGVLSGEFCCVSSSRISAWRSLRLLLDGGIGLWLGPGVFFTDAKRSIGIVGEEALGVWPVSAIAALFAMFAA